MSEISSGLVAVAEVGAGFSLRWTEPDYGCSCKHHDKLVRLSDAEAIILDLQNLVTAENQRKQQFEAEVAAKDAEILEQCRINGMGAEREATLLGKVERQSAALKLAREALFDMQDSYAAVHGWKDSFVIAATTAIAAIDSLQKGE